VTDKRRAKDGEKSEQGIVVSKLVGEAVMAVNRRKEKKKSSMQASTQKAKT
jgi:hypothetical protein